MAYGEYSEEMEEMEEMSDEMADELADEMEASGALEEMSADELEEMEVIAEKMEAGEELSVGEQSFLGRWFRRLLPIGKKILPEILKQFEAGAELEEYAAPAPSRMKLVPKKKGTAMICYRCRPIRGKKPVRPKLGTRRA